MTESPTLGTRSTAATDAVRDAHSRLATVAEMLWPAADFERWIDRRSDERTGYLVLPSARRPRLLVPDDRRLIGTGIARSSVGSSLARSVAARAAARGLHRWLPIDRLGIRPRSTSAAGLARYLSETTGLDLDVLSIRFGSDRPNQKPVILMGDGGGDAIGFVKVGWNPLTTTLVANEARALRRAATTDLTPVRAPRLLHHSTWNGLAIAFIEALPVTSQSEPRPQLLADSVSSIARGHQTSTVIEEPLAALTARLERLADSVLRTTVLELVHRIEHRHRGTPVRVGAWHGDFRPWNVDATPRELLVWDWERWAPAGAVGLDAVHYYFPLPRRRERADSYRRRVEDGFERSRRILDRGAISPRSWPAIRALHVVELLMRELEDVAVMPEIARPERTRRLIDLVEEIS